MTENFAQLFEESLKTVEMDVGSIITGVVIDSLTRRGLPGAVVAPPLRPVLRRRDACRGRRTQPERHLEAIHARLRHRCPRRDEKRRPRRNDSKKLDQTDRQQREEIRGRQWPA